jgi:hypothetical protein
MLLWENRKKLSEVKEFVYEVYNQVKWRTIMQEETAPHHY